MQSVIVTVRDSGDRFQYDMEVPSDLKGNKLTDDLLEALNGVNPALCYNAMTHGIFLNRVGRFLGKDETMAEAGALNGDYVTIEMYGAGRA